MTQARPKTLAGYSAALETLGYPVQTVQEIPWFRYNGFLRPALLPHASSFISKAEARAALRKTGAMFARWESMLDQKHPSDWWHVIRRGPYAIEQLSANTRSKVRRGLKRLHVRALTPEEVQEACPRVCLAAVERFNDTQMLPDAKAFMRCATALKKYAQHVEVIGVWRGKALVGYAENHVEDDGVLIHTLWYDPSALRDYSSYVLMHAMLHRYLNDKGASYISDGARMLYHQTNVHDFLIEKFGFYRAGALLNVVYHPAFRLCVNASYPFRPWIQRFSSRWDHHVFHKAEGILKQEQILRMQAGVRG